MKKFLLLISLMVLNIVLISTTAYAVDNLKIGVDGISGPEITYDEVDLIAGITQTLADGTIITAVVITENGGVYYLEATGTLGANSIIVGIELSQDGNGLYLFAGAATNKCTGDPCEKCSFTRDGSGEIDGCDCGLIFGLCNHTITDGFAENLINNL